MNYETLYLPQFIEELKFFCPFLILSSQCVDGGKLPPKEALVHIPSMRIQNVNCEHSRSQPATILEHVDCLKGGIHCSFFLIIWCSEKEFFDVQSV